MLQLHAVLAQDACDLSLVRIQFTHSAVHEQFGTLADVGQWRLQLMRHVAQEAVAFLCQVQQALAQPLQLPAESLKVHGAHDADRTKQRAAAQLIDGAVNLAQWSAKAEREGKDGDRGER